MSLISRAALVRGMMAIDPASRFTLERIRDHPWFTRYFYQHISWFCIVRLTRTMYRPNRYLARNGLCIDGVNLATKMMENLRVDFTRQPSTRAALDDNFSRISSTQPVTPATDVRFEWERPHHMFASQPAEVPHEFDSQSLWASLAEDPTMSQFAPQPHLSISLASISNHILCCKTS
jgi:serine/threonine-protein kinase Chk1